MQLPSKVEQLSVSPEDHTSRIPQIYLILTAGILQQISSQTSNVLKQSKT